MSEIQQRLPPVHTKPAPGVHHTAATAAPAGPASAPKSVSSPSDKVQQPQYPSPPRPQSQNAGMAQNPVHPNAKTTTHVNNGTTTTKTNITSPICRNCKTQTTPLWRRDETGQVLCNACGLFLKLHGRPRPISLKTDTIKSRNRIKQQPQNGSAPGTANSSKTNSGPNTPELKSKDSKGSGKKSPKSKKAKTASTDLTPLLPAAGSVTSAGNSTVSTPTSLRNATTPSAAATASGAFLHPLGSTFHHHHHHHHLPPHLTPSNPPQVPGMASHHHPHHVVQPLHYPSSTPTQFAPGLQRITSPLLLSTTSSVSNTRDSEKLNPVHAAAGALENMSNELGPSATFKSGSTNVTGVSLMNKSKSKEIKRESSSPSIFSTPSSALSASHYTSNTNGAPKLPALGISSPSFGPQFHFTSQQGSQASTPAASQVQSPENSHASTVASSTNSANGATSLPPINQVAGESKSSLPHFQNNFNNYSGQSNNQQSSYNGYNGNEKNGKPNDNSGSGKDGSGSGSGSGAGSGSNTAFSNNNEITLLKTRISELELVNDLYRTRIMELEAMEQAARLRENSMKKRLDEVLNLNNNSQGSPALNPASTSTYPSSTPIPATTSSAPSAPGSSGSALPPSSSGLTGYQHHNNHQRHQVHQQPHSAHHGTVLPSIRQVPSSSLPPSSASSGITLPALKREYEDGAGSGYGDDDSKKPKLG